MDEQSAREEAHRRNVLLGDQGVTDRYFVEVQEAGGWTVQERAGEPQRQSWLGRLVDGAMNYWP